MNGDTIAATARGTIEQAILHARLASRIDVEIDVLIVGAGCQLGFWLYHSLSSHGHRVGVISKSMTSLMPRDRIRLATGCTIIWLSGYTRPNDKNRPTPDFLAYCRSYLEDVRELCCGIPESVRIVLIGSVLQIQEGALELPYVVSKRSLRKLFSDTFADVREFLVPNNEGLLRPYEHWLQTLLYRLCFPDTVSATSLPLMVDPYRSIDLVETRSLSIHITQAINNQIEGDLIFLSGRNMLIEDLILLACNEPDDYNFNERWTLNSLRVLRMACSSTDSPQASNICVAHTTYTSVQCPEFRFPALKEAYRAALKIGYSNEL